MTPAHALTQTPAQESVESALLYDRLCAELDYRPHLSPAPMTTAELVAMTSEAPVLTELKEQEQ